MSTLRAAAVLALLLAMPAAAQQGQQAPPAGDPAVQSVVPEVGGGRGGVGAGQVPESTDQPPTGGERPAPLPERAAPTPTAPVPAAPPLTARGDPFADEMELLRTLRGGLVQGRTTLPDTASTVLIQPEGRDWREFRNTGCSGSASPPCSAWSRRSLASSWCGPKRIEAGRAGPRHPALLHPGAREPLDGRHAFVLLGLSGLNITYGASVLLPVIGPEAFTALTFWGQAAHQYLSFPFVLGLV